MYLHTNYWNKNTLTGDSVKMFGSFTYHNDTYICGKTCNNIDIFVSTTMYNTFIVTVDKVRPSSEKSVVADFVGVIANDVMETQKSIVVVCRYFVNQNNELQFV